VGSRKTLGGNSRLGGSATRPRGRRSSATPGRSSQLTVRVAGDRVRLPLSAGRVRRVVRAVWSAEGRAAEPPSRQADVSIVFVGPARMRLLNRAWKRHDRATDVLAFTLHSPGGGLTGEVYICAAIARAAAREHGVPAQEELVRLVVHGTLHLLGYDHPESAARTRSPMWRRQERFVEALA